MEEKKNEIILFENQGIKLQVNLKEETVWLTQAQMEELFDVKQSTLSEHINNIFKEGELEEKTSIGNSDKSSGGRKSKLYNLDVIISVGYRVKSKNGVIFRQWANKILKDYMLKGYAVNQKRLEYLEKTIQLIDIANRIDERLEGNDAKEILKVIGNYSKALDLLDDYDHKTLKKIDGNIDERKIEYKQCIEIINKLRFNEESTLFAIERDKGLESIIGNIYQSFDGQDIYKSIEEKGANFLYLIVKNHVFADGNKRIAATLFIYFYGQKDIYYCIKGQGAFCNGEHIYVSKTDKLNNSIISFCLTSHYNDKHIKEVLNLEEKLASKVRGLRLIVSADIELAWCAAGKIDGCLNVKPSIGLSSCAGKLLVQEAGGKVTNLQGNTRENIDTMLVTNGNIHNEIVSIINNKI